jgi:hypothetical protein
VRPPARARACVRARGASRSKLTRAALCRLADTNNAWMTGAENHQPSGVSSTSGAGFDMTPYPEGDFYVRMSNALQALYEYEPIREPTAAVVTALTSPTYLSGAGVQLVPGSPATNVTAMTRARMAGLQRTFDFGGLITYALTEDRVSYRTSAQAVNNNGLSLPLGTQDCPAGVAAAATAVAAGKLGDVQCSPAYAALVAGGLTTLPPANWTSAAVAAVAAAYQAMTTSPLYYGNTSQHIIGTTPTAWLGATFAASKANSIPFQVWASQTVFQTVATPDFINGTSATNPLARSTSRTQAPVAAAMCQPGFFGASCAASLAGLPWAADDWDGFHAERLSVLAALAQGNTPIVNSGDAHGFWLGTVGAAVQSGSPVVVEFAGGSVTSQGWGDYFPGVAAAPVYGYTLNAANNAFLNMLEDGFVTSNANTGMVASRHLHGALVFEVTATSYIGQVFTIDTMNSSAYNIMCDYAYTVPVGTKGVMTNLAQGGTPGCVSTVGGVVPGTFNGTAQLGLATVASPAPAATAFSANIDGTHVSRWFTGGGGMCQASTSVADCSYRRRLVSFIKNSLQTCAAPLTPHDFSVSHRGAPLLFPEHTMEGYAQALNDGAMWIECDTAPTKDMELVCRHSTCDLHATTNVLSIPALAAKCTVPNSKCCTYDFTLAEYNTLCGVR